MSSVTPQFTGRYKDFHLFIGPYLRNVVQMLTRPHKAAIGACQHCADASGPLDAAHVHGHERPTIARNIIEPADDDTLVTVDLAKFMEQFKAAHAPIERAILFLYNTARDMT